MKHMKGSTKIHNIKHEKDENKKREMQKEKEMKKE